MLKTYTYEELIAPLETEGFEARLNESVFRGRRYVEVVNLREVLKDLKRKSCMMKSPVTTQDDIDKAFKIIFEDRDDEK